MLGAAALMAGTMVGFVLAWTVLIVEAAGVLMLLLTAGLYWPRRSAPRSAGG